MDISKSRWIVTGHRGFIGQNLVARLGVAKGVDIKDGLSARNYIDKLQYDVLMHLAALPGIGSCEDDIGAAVNSNLATMAIFRNVNAKRRIFASSMAAAGAPTSVYGWTKQAGESLAGYLGNIACARFSNVFGPWSQHKSSCVAAWCREALNHGSVTVHGTGQQLRDFIYVGDLIDGILTLAASDECGVFEMGSGIARPIMQVAEMIADISGAKIKRLSGVSVSHSEPADIERLHLMGWRPSTDIDSLRANVERTFRWFEERDHVAVA